MRQATPKILSGIREPFRLTRKLCQVSESFLNQLERLVKNYRALQTNSKTLQGIKESFRPRRTSCQESDFFRNQKQPFRRTRKPCEVSVGSIDQLERPSGEKETWKEENPFD